MDYIVQFEDEPTQSHQRAAHMQDHLSFLARTPEIVRAGPLAGPEGAAGGLWHVRTTSSEAVSQLVRTDPFWPTGLRKSVRILEWTVVHGD